MSEALVALFAALLSGIGVGSGGFYLLYLTDVAGLSQYTAQGVNLVFFTVATLASSLLSLRSHRLSLSRLFALLSLGIPGAFFGGALTLFLPPSAARQGLGLLLLLGGLITLRSALLRRRQKREKKHSRPV